MFHSHSMRAARFAWHLAIAVLLPQMSWGADLAQTEAEFRGGKYPQVIAAAEESLKTPDVPEDWAVLQLQAQLATGQYAEAKTAWDTLMVRYPNSLRLRL